MGTLPGIWVAMADVDLGREDDLHAPPVAAPLAVLADVAAPSRAGPLQFQYRVLKAIILRDFASRNADSRIGPLLSVLLPVLTFAVLIVAFQLRGKTVPSEFPFGVFIMTGYPLWMNFQSLYSRVTGAANKSDALLMFPQITQLDLIVSTIILDMAINTVVYIFLVIGVIILLSTPIPRDPVGVILVYWSCAWMGSSFGLIMASAARLFPMLPNLVNPFLRFGMWVSGVVFMIDRMPSWTWPYLRWNPILHAVEGARQLWTGYQSPIFDPLFIVSIGFVMTTTGLVLERITRRHVGP